MDELNIFVEAEKNRNELIGTFASRIASGDRIRVVFLGYALGGASDVFSGLYRRFAEDIRFESYMIIVPNTYGSEKEMLDLYESAVAFLEKKGIPFINGYNKNTNEFFDAAKTIDPDIVFMTHPYDWFREEFKIDNYINKIVYMFSYGLRLVEMDVKYNRSNALARKMFYEAKGYTRLHINQKYSITDNIMKTYLGHPKYDELIFTPREPVDDIWPIKDRAIKRIIWAPHHTDFKVANFIELKDFFLELVKSDPRIQIVFRPHPGLSGSLVRNNGWSETEVEQYYSEWENLANGALSDKDDIYDLFLTSDAMILDSLSFIAEYQLVDKPSLYINKPDKPIPLNDFGKKVKRSVYDAYNIDDILSFINNIVIQGKDHKGWRRRRFVKQHLIPPYDKTAYENIYDYVVKDIKIG